MKPANYFNPDDFIRKVIEACKFGNLKAENREQIGARIEKALKERVIATILASFNDRDFELLEKTMEDHPELSDLNAILLVGENIEGIEEQLSKAIDDLFYELTSNASEIQKQMDESSISG